LMSMMSQPPILVAGPKSRPRERHHRTIAQASKSSDNPGQAKITPRPAVTGSDDRGAFDERGWVGPRRIATNGERKQWGPLDAAPGKHPFRAHIGQWKSWLRIRRMSFCSAEEPKGRAASVLLRGKLGSRGSGPPLPVAPSPG